MKRLVSTFFIAFFFFFSFDVYANSTRDIDCYKDQYQNMDMAKIINLKTDVMTKIAAAYRKSSEKFPEIKTQMLRYHKVVKNHDAQFYPHLSDEVMADAKRQFEEETLPKIRSVVPEIDDLLNRKYALDEIMFNYFYQAFN
jgi:tRNA/tmRNA/rRNA uracil-C5-methylase (TrmA/RlmC/RlmD family)